MLNRFADCETSGSRFDRLEIRYRRDPGERRTVPKRVHHIDHRI